jgi:trimethylamine--corrinoid protein Co-methyltransferase
MEKTMRVNVGETTHFRILSRDQIEEIIGATLEILERVGVMVSNEEALKLLEDGGARVDGQGLVRIPSAMVQRALGTAPHRIVLANRDGQRTLALEKNRIYFGTGSDCPYVIDPYTDERRPCLFDDVQNAAKVADALGNIDFLMSLGLVSDVPRLTYDRHQFLAMAMGTKKPLVITCVDRNGLSDQYEMACRIVGGEKHFQDNPYFAVYAEPSSPLTHSKEALEKLTFAAERGIPVVYTPCPSGGATAPVTMAGILAQGLAETLSGLVISQVKSPGAPFIMGGVHTIMDMRTSIFSYGAPELSLLSACMTDISKELELPIFSTAGCGDAKVLDEQAAIEASVSLVTAGLSGANLIHDVGYLESGLLGSLDMLVLSDEVISMVKRILRGMRVDDEALALDVIANVGPGGHFVGEEHTRRHLRGEHWLPKLMDRTNRETWERGGAKTMDRRVREKVTDILEQYEPDPLDEKLLGELKTIVALADERYGQK